MVKRTKFAGSDGSGMQTPAMSSNVRISLDLIVIHPQVRTQFEEEQLKELATSLVDLGQMQNIGLHERGDGKYDLIWGERRVRAARLANLDALDAVIRTGLIPAKTRKLQIAENNQQVPLSMFDVAVGVANDATAYGVHEAAIIWERSEGWVSKRAGVLNYHQPISKLLSDGVCGDVEVLQSLDQLYTLNEKEYGYFENRLRSGRPVGRDEVRNKVANVKQWQRNKKMLDKIKAPKAPTKSHSKEGTQVAIAPSPLSIPNQGPATSAGKAAPLSAKESSSDVLSRQTKSVPEQKAEKQRAALEEHFRNLLVDVYDAADPNRRLLSELQVDLEKLNCDMNETDWVLWSGFLTLVLPMLEALGPERSIRYLKRLPLELKGKTPAAAWAELHPPLDGNEKPSSLRQEIAVMPVDWHF